MEKWRGKNAIVTGASSGIGAAIVKELVKEGVNVVGLARRVERVQVGFSESELNPIKNNLRLDEENPFFRVISTFSAFKKEKKIIYRSSQMNSDRLRERFTLNNATSPMKNLLKLPLSSSKPWEVLTFA